MLIATCVTGGGVGRGGDGGEGVVVEGAAFSFLQENIANEISRSRVKFFIKLGLSEFPTFS